MPRGKGAYAFLKKGYIEKLFIGDADLFLYLFLQHH
jgi:hypothetical protein